MSEPFADLPAPTPVSPEAPTNDERTWAMTAHLLAIFVAFPGPLIIYLAKDNCPFVRRHALQALVFNLALCAVAGLAGVFAFITCGFGVVAAIPVIFAVVIACVFFPVIGCIRAIDGRDYSYPLTGSMVK